MRGSIIAWLLMLGLSCSSVSAAPLLVYEPFSNYSVGTIHGQSVSGATLGMSGSYTVTANSGSGQIFNASNTGLTFGSGPTALSTSGGSLFGSNNLGGRISVPLNVSAQTGTIYSSYLLELLTNPTAGDDVFATRVTDGTGTTNVHFRVDPVSGATGNDTVGISYQSNAGSSSTSLGLSKYIVLSSFTRVGQTVDVSNPGVATVWILTEAQYDNFKSGGLTDAELNAATVGASSSNITARVSDTMTALTTINTFGPGSYFQLGLQGDQTSGTSPRLSVNFDELRYGLSLDDVTPLAIPEPALVTGCLVLGLVVGCKMRKKLRT